MRTLYTIAASLTLLLSQHALAVTSSDPFEASSKDCEMIANTCLNAGYAREGAQGKEFWHDCMKPVLLGNSTVAGVTIDPNTVKMCRQFKITNLMNQINALRKVQSSAQ